MNQWVKIQGVNYPIMSCIGLRSDTLGSVRDCIKFTLEMSAEQVQELFIDNMEYSIVQESQYYTSKDEVMTETEEYDQSQYSLSGDIIDHRDGTCSILMGMPTETEELLMQLYSED